MGIITWHSSRRKAWNASLKSLMLGALLLGAVGLLSAACGQDEGPATQPPPGESSTKESAGGDTVNNRVVLTTESQTNPTPRPVQTKDSDLVQQIPPTAAPIPTARPLQLRGATPVSTATPAPAALEYRGASAEEARPTGIPAPSTALMRVQLSDPDPQGTYPLGAGGTDTVNDAAYDLVFFKHYGVNPFIDTEDDRLSTFAMDVDTASYAVARRFIMDGNLPLNLRP